MSGISGVSSSARSSDGEVGGGVGSLIAGSGVGTSAVSGADVCPSSPPRSLPICSRVSGPARYDMAHLVVKRDGSFSRVL